MFDVVRAALKEFRSSPVTSVPNPDADKTTPVSDDALENAEGAELEDVLVETGNPLSESTIQHYVMLENRRSLVGISKRLTRG